MMFGWETNKTLLRKYMIDHAADIGAFWADIFMNTPKIYSDFMRGFFEEVERQQKKE
jgi:hypothetical protein